MFFIFPFSLPLFVLMVFVVITYTVCQKVGAHSGLSDLLLGPHLPAHICPFTNRVDFIMRVTNEKMTILSGLVRTLRKKTKNMKKKLLVLRIQQKYTLVFVLKLHKTEGPNAYFDILSGILKLVFNQQLEDNRKTKEKIRNGGHSLDTSICNHL